MTRRTLRHALNYASLGWPVFPCRPGQKVPATRHGYLDATTDSRQITSWFGRHPDWNLAIATGAPGPDVLDVDQHGPAGNGFGALARLRAAGLLDGATAYVRTPSGGQHAYFTGTQQRNGHLPSQHIDFRSAGGYVLVPPSHVDGQAYEFTRIPNGHGHLDWQAVTRLLSTSGQPPASPAGRAPATWPTGSRPSPRATATPAFSGLPAVPWKPTPSPISAPWRQPRARPDSARRRSPAPSTPPAAPAAPRPEHKAPRPRERRNERHRE